MGREKKDLMRSAIKSGANVGIGAKDMKEFMRVSKDIKARNKAKDKG